MPIIKQLRKVGNSSAITLDKTLLELVGLKEKGTVQVDVRDGAIVLTPVNPAVIDGERFKRLMDEIFHDRRSALKRLAE